MSEFLSHPFVDVIRRFGPPALQVLVPLASVVLLWLSVRWASRSLTRTQRPQIECFLRFPSSSYTVDLVLANFGMGSAYRVSFRLDADETDFVAHKVFMQHRRSVAPFPVLEPRGEITTLFGGSVALLKRDAVLKPFRVFVSYQWQPFWSKRRCAEERVFDIDIRPYTALFLEVKKNQVAEILKSELPKISAAVAKVRVK